MSKPSNTELIDKLSKFRTTADKLSDDVFELAGFILNLGEFLEKKQDKSPAEEEIADKIRGKADFILTSVLNASSYNDSVMKDYTSVIRTLGREGVKTND